MYTLLKNYDQKLKKNVHSLIYNNLCILTEMAMQYKIMQTQMGMKLHKTQMELVQTQNRLSKYRNYSLEIKITDHINVNKID